MATSLEAELRRTAREDWAATIECVAGRIRKDGRLPRDTGALAESIQFDGAVNWVTTTKLAGVIRQDTAAAPHGQIINNPKKGVIKAKRAQALAFTPKGSSETIFRRQVTQSMEHKGWWKGTVEDRAIMNTRIERCWGLT